MTFMQFWQQFGMTVLGSGFGTAGIGLLFKHNFDRKLEAQKDLLARASRLHERQIDILSKLWQELYEVHEAFQLSGPGLGGSDEMRKKYLTDFWRGLQAAHKQFIRSRLFIRPFPEIETLIEAFFAKCYSGRFELFRAQLPDIPGSERAAAWDKVGSIAYADLPTLLQELTCGLSNVITEPSHFKAARSGRKICD